MKPSRPIPLLTACAAATLTLSACAYNAQLGRDQLLLVDDAALAQSAQQAWTQALSTQKRSTNAAYNTRVRTVGSRIVQAAGLAGQSWEYVVFDNATPNAFVLPGGKIGVNSGLLTMVRNDDQLAAVLGHEVAHSVARHAAERYSQTALASVGLGVAQAAAGGYSETAARAVSAFGGAGAQLGYLLPFSRRHELEADRLGVDYMQAAGYDPAQALALWRMMAAERTGGSTPQWASTHPSDATRIQALEAYLNSRGWG